MDLARFAILTLAAILTTSVVFGIYFLIKKLIRNRSKVRSKHVYIALALLVGVVVIYWFVARPYFVTRSCKNVALQATGYTNDNSQAWASNPDIQSKYIFVYGVCMQKEGINP